MVDLSKLIYTTLFDLPKLDFPPKIIKLFYIFGFLIITEPSIPSCSEKDNFLQLESPLE